MIFIESPVPMKSGVLNILGEVLVEVFEKYDAKLQPIVYTAQTHCERLSLSQKRGVGFAKCKEMSAPDT
ncbi:hypothetical protein SAMN05216326_10413 [Nitrosomonas marina]|uniref:Uncharacterized protein n=1 Tax=Nitrosomonas marina TaxID=917 RepID=A0A1H9ZG67_9PROT|nr:hypothetical protein SAMN05216326_10413 [Nitrosomonas marina]